MQKILCRMIAPEWLMNNRADLSKVLEGEFTRDEIATKNLEGYNIYTLPNRPKVYYGGTVKGQDIDQFDWVFVDCDLKDKVYPNKEAFISKLVELEDLIPSKIVDSGGGVHAYWRVSDLDVKSYIRFQRRLMRYFDTDPAVGQIFQLMRLDDTLNTKIEGQPRECKLLFDDPVVYTSEQLDKILPAITMEDEKYCQQHYNSTFNLEEEIAIDEKLPDVFGKLLHENDEVKALFCEPADDRSKNDFRLAHIMFGHKFTKDQAMSVLYNTSKAMQRAPHHRQNYAKNIVDKIWTYEELEDPIVFSSSPTVRQILSKGEEAIKGTRFPCHKLVDDTVHGYRLGQVIGIVGGSGVGKTTLTLNMFLWFSSNNPDFHHFFFSLEQPVGEIASRIRTICGDDDSLFDKIHIVSNYSEDGTYKNFSLKSIQEHILSWEKETGKKTGAVVIDHIGVLAKNTKNGENNGLIGICQDMKAVAVTCNIMLLMLSQAPREKAGIGDLELDKDAAYGTLFFEAFVDYCICLWAPLKRVYSEGAPCIMAIKFAKIRHKKQGQDKIQEDIRYNLFFDSNNERLRELTQDEETSVKFYMNRAINARKADKKTDLVTYVSRRVDEPTRTTNRNTKSDGH